MDNIAYICDRQKDCNTSSSCGKECIRTCDISHSLNYSHSPDIEELRKNFDVSGYGSNEKWYEKFEGMTAKQGNELAKAFVKGLEESVKATGPIIEGGNENGRTEENF